LLTPAGVVEKVELMALFLQYKMEEYERLKTEIQTLQNEIGEVSLEGKSAS
jgi:uncharacterized protein (UPF0335 family)